MMEKSQRQMLIGQLESAQPGLYELVEQFTKRLAEKYPNPITWGTALSLCVDLLCADHVNERDVTRTDKMLVNLVESIKLSSRWLRTAFAENGYAASRPKGR